MLYTFDFKEVACIVAGLPMQGFVEGGDSIGVEMDEDAFTKSVGADGETARVKRNHHGGTMTLRLMQTSPSNDVLSALAIADRLTNDGIAPVALKDLSGRTTLFSATGWIRRMPSASLGTELGTREWVIDLVDVDYFLGGNPQVVAG